MLHAPDAGHCRRLRSYFEETGYDSEDLKEHVVAKHPPTPRRGIAPELLEATAAPTALNLLMRLFMLNVPVDAGVARRTLPDWFIDEALRAGLLAGSGGELRPEAMITVLDRMLVVSDPMLRHHDSPADLVIWPNPTTREVLNFTVRRPTGASLDLGCGTGALALLLAAHSAPVTATDLNPRAGEFTLFNAALNGVEIEYLTGDSFKPVAGRRFDLIVANPPFFVTPVTDLMYCQNPGELDSFCRQLTRDAAAHLTEGGMFQMIFESTEIEGQSWEARMREWMEGLGCDGWMIRQYAVPPLHYAAERVRQIAPAGSEVQETERWVAYYEGKHVTAIHAGLLAMRRRSGPNWLRIDDQPLLLAHPAGETIVRGFETWDALHTLSGDDLLARMPVLDASAQLHQVSRQENAAWQVAAAKLRLTGPLLRELDVDPLVARFLGRCDGTRTIASLAQQLAGEAGVPVDRVMPEALAIARRLAAQGYLSL